MFMTVNMLVSAAALVRYDQRSKGVKADNAVERLIDRHFNDERMAKIYPNAKSTG